VTTSLASIGPAWLSPDTIISSLGPWALVGVALIIFAECGLLLGFFLPGDSLLFTAGLFAVSDVGIGAPLAEIQTKFLDMQLAVNLRSIILGTREGLPLLRKAGAEHRKALIVNTASIAGKAGQPWLAIYGATKAAVVNYSVATEREVGAEGIACTALAPAFVDTAMTDFVKGAVPAEEMIRPSDIGEAVRYLVRTSPNCHVPEIVFTRPGEAIGAPA